MRTRAREDERARDIARETVRTAARVVVGLLLTSCIVNEPNTPSTGVAVSGPPPAPIAEALRPPAPAHAVWVAGYWHWTGVHYTWIPGHWDEAPPGATWAAPQYVSRDGAYFYQPGAWRGAPRAPQNANAFR
jgi:hypothetical protein